MKHFSFLILVFSSLLATRSLVTAELPTTIRTLRFSDGSTLQLVPCCSRSIGHPFLKKDPSTECANSEECPAVSYLKRNSKDGNKTCHTIIKCSHVVSYLEMMEKKLN